MRHYEFTGEKQGNLNRIRALVDLPHHGVKAGDLGGWVENYANLSGQAWVADSAQVYGRALVSGRALVCGSALVYGDARVFGSALVYGSARVFGSALVYGSAQVFGSAQVSGEALVYGSALIESHKDYLTIGPAKSSGRFTTAHKTAEGIQVNTGCFSGDLHAFSKAIEETHKGENLEQYRLFCQLIAFNFGVTP